MHSIIKMAKGGKKPQKVFGSHNCRARIFLIRNSQCSACRCSGNKVHKCTELMKLNWLLLRKYIVYVPCMVSYMISGAPHISSGGPQLRKYILHAPQSHSRHYIDVIMTTMASQITSLTIVYSTVYSDADHRKHQGSASLAFVWGIHRDRWIPRTKGQLRGNVSIWWRHHDMYSIVFLWQLYGCMMFLICVKIPHVDIAWIPHKYSIQEHAWVSVIISTSRCQEMLYIPLRNVIRPRAA